MRAKATREALPPDALGQPVETKKRGIHSLRNFET